MPFLDAAQVSGPALIVDDEGHSAMAQTLLKHNQSAHAAVAVLEGVDLLKPHMEVQDLIPLNLSLVLVVPDQLCQTGIDPAHRQQLPIPGSGGRRPVLAGADLLAVGIHRTGHQDLVKLPDELLSQGLHYMIQDVVDAVDMLSLLDDNGELLAMDVAYGDEIANNGMTKFNFSEKISVDSDSVYTIRISTYASDSIGVVIGEQPMPTHKYYNVFNKDYSDSQLIYRGDKVEDANIVMNIYGDH